MPPRRPLATLLSLLLTAVAIPAARADEGASCPELRCSAAPVDFAYGDALFDPFSYRTDWFPADAHVQLRIGVELAGQTEIDMSGGAVVAWPTAPAAGVEGLPRGGRLAFAYGVDVSIEVRIDVDLPGEGHFSWEGELPPWSLIPTDLMVDGETTFDPFALDGEVSATGETQRVRVVGYDLDEDLIPIPGITGKIALEVKAGLTTVYGTHEIAIAEAGSLRAADATVPIAPPGAGGYGPALELELQPHGYLRYTGSLTFYPQFRIKILGITVGRLDLFEWAIDVFHKDLDVQLDPERVLVPLPDVAVDTHTISVRPGATTQLAIHNRGDAPLVVRPAEPLASLAISDATIPAGTSQTLLITPTDERIPMAITLLTNDPDTPELELALQLGDTPADDATEPHGPDGPGPGGCSAGTDRARPPVAALLVLAIACGAGRGRRRPHPRRQPR